jgi:hypothetical protein
MEAFDDLLQILVVDEEEIDNLVFEEEAEVPKEGIKWRKLPRVHTSNFFSLGALRNTCTRRGPFPRR